jgi:hypothetical protein
VGFVARYVKEPFLLHDAILTNSNTKKYNSRGKVMGYGIEKSNIVSPTHGAPPKIGKREVWVPYTGFRSNDIHFSKTPPIILCDKVTPPPLYRKPPG